MNQRRIVNTCGHKLATQWQNFTKIHSARVKILLKVLGEGYFSHCTIRRAQTTVTKRQSIYLISIFICFITNHTALRREKKQRNRTDKAYSSYSRPKKQNKKLIRRWDSERELSVRWHRTRITKYNRLVHKLIRHRSTRLCVETHVYQIQWNNGHYAVQRHSRSPILVPIESSYTTSY